MKHFDLKWNALVAVHPVLARSENRIQIPVRRLKSLLRQFYNSAEDYQRRVSRMAPLPQIESVTRLGDISVKKTRKR